MHKFCLFCIWCILHFVLDKMNQKKYGFPMQRKIPYIYMYIVCHLLPPEYTWSTPQYQGWFWLEEKLATKSVNACWPGGGLNLVQSRGSRGQSPRKLLHFWQFKGVKSSHHHVIFWLGILGCQDNPPPPTCRPKTFSPDLHWSQAWPNLDQNWLKLAIWLHRIIPG